jgi:M6 family metalloprotease-like protein
VLVSAALQSLERATPATTMKSHDAFRTFFRLIAGLLVFTTSVARAQSLADFGYQNMKVNGQLPSGTRPLLIIRADIAGDDNTTHPASYYDTLVFNFLTFPSVNGFMLVNSGGRFYFTRGGSGMVDLINGVNFTAAEKADFGSEVKRAGHCINAAARAGFNFSALDANGDGTITQDELVVLIVENSSTGDSGAARWANPDGTGAGFTIQGTTTKFQSGLCLVTQNVSVATLCHELSHVLGTVDVYGVWNQEALSSGLTTMSATITFANNPAIYQFDPWHKLQLGWCEPRIRNMYWGGVETLSGSGVTAADKQVILYDSGRGTGEFFILEYRSVTAQSYDDQANDTGLVIWHVQQDSAHNLVQVPTPYVTNPPPAPTATHQTMWLESPTTLIRGGGQWGPPGGQGAWHSGTTTPLLKWNDGTASATQIRVRPFGAGATSITVEILTARETWVDFAYVPPPLTPGIGTFNRPFTSLTEGVNNSSWGGTIIFKTGHTVETGTISKPLTFKAYSGAVTLGR